MYAHISSELAKANSVCDVNKQCKCHQPLDSSSWCAAHTSTSHPTLLCHEASYLPALGDRQHCPCFILDDLSINKAICLAW